MVGVEAELVVGNPGPPDDTLTMVLLDASERSVAVVSKTVPTANCEHVLFVFPTAARKSRPGNSTVSGWYGLSVAGPFVCRCLTSFTMLPFPHPAHRTGWADFPLPALGERFTMSPTGDGSSAW